VLVLLAPDYFGARVLWGLAAAGFEVAGVFQSAKDRGKTDAHLRRRNPAFSVAAFLERHGLAAERLADRQDWPRVLRAIEERDAGLLLAVHFPWLVPATLLERLPGRTLNLHPTLLPACRGPHPFAALLAEDLAGRHGGATLHLMTAAADAGPIVAQEAVPLSAGANLLAWQLEIARAYGRLVGEPLADYLAGRRPALPQDESRATPADIAGLAGRLDLDERLPAVEALRRARLFGQVRALQVRAGGRHWQAMLPARVVGPRTGVPPRLGPLWLSFDVADARLALRRRWTGAGRRQRRRLRRQIARAAP